MDFEKLKQHIVDETCDHKDPRDPFVQGIYAAIEVLEDEGYFKNTQSPATVDGDYTQKRIKELIEDEQAGFWRSCSGCHETEDGYDVGHYPHSQLFNCKVGAGCSECGGIGVVWDNTDYEDLARFMAEDDTPQPSPASDQVAANKSVERAFLRIEQIVLSPQNPVGGGHTFDDLNTIRTALSQAAQPVVSREDAKAALDHMLPMDYPEEGRSLALEHWQYRYFETIRTLLKERAGSL